MPHSDAFLAALEANGYDFFAGVPCSLLKGVIRKFDQEPRWGYVPAVREDSAVGLAVGAWMAGKKPALFMQNSGLGVCFNALTSLSIPYRLPALIVTSWRGQGGKDAPEHIVMGAIMEDYFKLIDLPYRVLSPETLEEDVAAITQEIDRRQVPGGLIVPKGVLNAKG